MGLSGNNNAALWNWLRGMLPVFGKGYPVVDANIISGGSVTTPEQLRTLYTVAPILRSGTGAIAESVTIADTAVITVFVTFKSGGTPTKPTTPENLIFSVDRISGAQYDAVLATGDPSLGEATGDMYLAMSAKNLLYPADALVVSYPGSDGLDWTIEVYAGVP